MREDKIVRRIFGLERDEIEYKQLYHLYTLYLILLALLNQRVSLVEHVAGDTVNTFRIFVGHV